MLEFAPVIGALARVACGHPFASLIAALGALYVTHCAFEWATRPAAMKLAAPRRRPRGTLPIFYNTFQSLANAHHIYDWLVAQCERFDGKPYWLQLVGGPSVVVLSTPEHFEEVLKTHFETFDKGPIMNENLRDLLGDGIFAVDSAKWVHQRKTASNLFSLRSLRESMAESIQKHALVLNKVFDRAARSQQSLDLFKLLNRFTMETFAEIGFGVELGALASDHDHAFQAAFDSAQRVLGYRFMRPQWTWKLQRYLNIGAEKGLKRSIQVINDTVFGIIEQSLENRRMSTSRSTLPQGKKDIVSLFLDHMSDDHASKSDPFDPTFLRDIVVNFLIAGRDTTAQALSWFFYCLSQHPDVEHKIRAELAAKLPELMRGAIAHPSMEQVNQLPYLEAALRETLRLYPSVPANIKHATKDTLFHDGTFIRQNEGAVISSYVLARMTHVWGHDAKEYRPERWLDAKSGRLVSESAFKFNTFHAGPRMCLGMNLAMMEMKIVVAMVVARFHLALVPGQHITYDFSLTHPIKGALMMNVTSSSAV
uniref:Cytochrome P450 n=1 Tax=Globisporangium ultimum (strain ATCC 200006 / CBS 805.95 / DAOM BR144) TaxID=431595 RepID=K3X3A6_GLOUD